jgi:hypothetical protein
MYDAQPRWIFPQHSYKTRTYLMSPMQFEITKFEPSKFRNSKIDIYNSFFQTLDDVKWKSDEYLSFIAH